MRGLSIWPAVLGLALAMFVVALVQPTPHSLSFGSAIVVIICLIGWVVEAREVAGPPPLEEGEEEAEEPAPGPSYWPVFLALGIVGIAAGLVYDWGSGMAVVAVPLAIGSAAVWAAAVRAEQAALIPVTAEGVVARPIRAAGGGLLMPVPRPTLAAQAAGGAAIAIERVGQVGVSRRGLLRVAFWAGLGATLAGSVGVLFDMLWPRGVAGFGSVVNAGTVSEFAPGTKTQVSEGRFWLVNLTEEQGGPGFLALWWKCPHLGCTVPWKPEFVFVDPSTGQSKRGWFRCPCHGSTYTDAGMLVFGPAPRSLDRMEVTIDPSSKRIAVNTGKVSKGTLDNAKFAVKA